MSDTSFPLDGLRVVDLTDGVAAGTGRFLADLGADVILVEPPAGNLSRQAQPSHDGHSLYFATSHANKRGIALDLTDSSGRQSLLELTDGADIVLESLPIGYLDGLGIGPTVLRERNPQLVVASITDFGQTGPYRDWQGSEAVRTAMASMLARSGAPNREPLVPPGELAGQTAAISSAYAALIAYHHAQHTGRGDYIDCSLFDLTVQDLDPGLGMAGTATMGRPLTELAPGRPDARMLYPIIPCADGHVRMFIASPKQWNTLYRWLGEPAEFADPSFSQMITRIMNWHKILPELERLFAPLTRAEISARGSEQGIAVSALHTPDEILHSDHTLARKSFVHAEIAPGLEASIPSGLLEIDGVRAGFRHRAPALNEHAGATWITDKISLGAAPAHAPRRPLQGVRVLDLGVIVVGAESGRALADQGADVIKVENHTFLDGARQADGPDICSHAFSVGHRGKRSLGLNLRSPEGKQLFEQLLAVSDVVLTNFKPGTLDSLGLGYDALEAVNPRIILVESSALGSTGPWSRQMGYGPLVRATVGLTTLWRHPDAADGFGDDMTVYPDHAAARVAVAAVTAALIERERTGSGRKINLAQMETVFSQLATDYVRESLEPGTMVARGNTDEFDAPSGLYPCTGDDGYCAITVRGNDQWRALLAVIGRLDLADDDRYATSAGRAAHRDTIDSMVSAWTAPLAPREAQNRLQQGGVPAGAVTHVTDLLTDPHLLARRAIGELPQPGYDPSIPVTNGPALFDAIPAPALRAAPLMAADSRDILRELLALSDNEIDELIESGVVETRGSTGITV